MLRNCLLVAALALIGGCKEAKETVSSLVGPTCETGQVEAARSEVEAWCTAGSFESATQYRLAEAPFAMPRVPDKWWGPERITVGPATLTNGYHDWKLEDFARDLSTYPVRIVRGEQETVEGPWPWLLAIAPNTPSEEIQPVLQMLVDAGQPRGALLFARTPDPPLPTPRDAEQHRELGSDDRASMAIARALEDVLSATWCGQYREAHEAIFQAPRAKRCEKALQTLPAAMEACGCRGDLDAMLTLDYAGVMGTGDPTTVLVATPVTVDPKAKAAPGRTWSEIAARLTPETVLWIASSEPNEAKPGEP